MTNILLTSAGRRVSLVRFFQKELRHFFPDAKVFTSDAHPELAAACRVSDGFFQVRRVTQEGYIEELLALALAHEIGLIIPTIDTELIILAQHRSLFAAKGIQIVISDLDKVTIFRDKRLTHQFFQANDFPCAQEYSKTNYQLPLYIKPYDGSRSVDNFIIHHPEQLTEYHFQNEKLLFLEYLDHRLHTEFTVDLYYDQLGKLKCVVPRQRIEVRDGEVNKAVTKDVFFIQHLWEKWSTVEGFRGCITLQVFVNFTTQQVYGIEINPRFGGGYPLSYLAGANFPQWILQEYLLQQTNLPEFHDWEQNMMMLRYDDEVIVRNYHD